MQLAYSIRSMLLSIENCVLWDGSVSCSWNHARISHHTCSFLQTSCGCCKTHTFICSVEYRCDVINDEISKLENTSAVTRREAWVAEITLKQNTNDEHDGKTRLFVRLLISLLQKRDSSLCKCSVEKENVSRHSAYIRRLTFRHGAFSILGQAFRYSPENALYIFNQQIHFIIWYLLDRALLI